MFDTGRTAWRRFERWPAPAVATTGTDADVVAKLVDVSPPDEPDSPFQPDPRVHLWSYQKRVHGEIMRGRLRRSFAAPTPFRPNERTTVDVRLHAVMHTFRTGHRIMVQAQRSWFPLFDRSPQTYVPSIYEVEARVFVKATHRVWASRDAASALRAQVLRRRRAAAEARDVAIRFIHSSHRERQR